MPLIVMTGYPASGKTSRAQELLAYAQEMIPPLPSGARRPVHLINEEGLGLVRTTAYHDANSEKKARAALYSAAERLLNQENIVILDTMNYIKGLRYQLYCLAKNAQTLHCLVWCVTMEESCQQLNLLRENAFTPQQVKELCMRYEEPDSRNRWDSPCHIIQKDDEKAPCEVIFASVLGKPTPKANEATINKQMSATNYIYELDQVTKKIVDLILNSQRDGLSGTALLEPQSGRQLVLKKHWVMAELRKMKKQFLTMNKVRTSIEPAKIATLFVEYINAHQ